MDVFILLKFVSLYYVSEILVCFNTFLFEVVVLRTYFFSPNVEDAGS